jgi:hypothetical protein
MIYFFACMLIFISLSRSNVRKSWKCLLAELDKEFNGIGYGVLAVLASDVTSPDMGPMSTVQWLQHVSEAIIALNGVILGAEVQEGPLAALMELLNKFANDTRRTQVAVCCYIAMAVATSETNKKQVADDDTVGVFFFVFFKNRCRFFNKFVSCLCRAVQHVVNFARYSFFLWGCKI